MINGFASIAKFGSLQPIEPIIYGDGGGDGGGGVVVPAGTVIGFYNGQFPIIRTTQGQCFVIGETLNGSRLIDCPPSGDENDETPCTCLNGYIPTIVAGQCVCVAPQNPVDPPPTACTMEAKICANGVAVGRNPAKNCAFDDCPSVTTTPTPTPATPTMPTSVAGVTEWIKANPVIAAAGGGLVLLLLLRG